MDAILNLTGQQAGYMLLRSKWQPWAPKSFSRTQALVLGQKSKCQNLICTVEFSKISSCIFCCIEIPYSFDLLYS